jgi:trehalose 6-phosphate synthase/phosphatase
VLPEERRRLDPLFTERHLVPVYLSAVEEERFYDGFSNRTLWPLCHSFPEVARIERSLFEGYSDVNRRYAEVIQHIYQPDDIIWVHDYQLMLLPGLLRSLLPTATIGYFHHIPFPSEHLFELLPTAWRSALLEGVLGANVVGFHTTDYLGAFLRAARRSLGAAPYLGEFAQPTHRCRAGVFPMGIDVERFERLAVSPLTKLESDRLTGSLGDRKVVISIDRLDYTKGILERLRAFKRFLELHPEWHERVSLALIVVPSRVGVFDYRATKRGIEHLVGSITGQFATPTWNPVLYRYRNLAPAELSALYQRGDVALVTPLRDGMNLVAKEYVASRRDNPGVLVLSTVAGAAQELSGALFVEPRDEDGVVRVLKTALEMPREERCERHRALLKQVRGRTVHRWGADFLEALGTPCRAAPQTGLLTVAREVVPRFRQARRRIVFLDYDGTLRSFEARPEAARPDRELLFLLERLSTQPGTTLVLVSGRGRETLDLWFGHLPIGLVGEHGGEVRSTDGVWSTRADITVAWKDAVRPYLERCVEAVPGSFIEEKRSGLVWHYRRAEGAEAMLRYAESRAHELADFFQVFLAQSELRLIPGNRALEIQVNGVDKGSAARTMIECGAYDYIAAFGDDSTDEDLFRVLPHDSDTVKVGGGASRARYRVADPAEVRLLLADWVAPHVDEAAESYFVPNNRSPASPSPGTM